MTSRRGGSVVLPAVTLLFLVLFSTFACGQDGGVTINQRFIDGVKMVKEQRFQEAITELQAAVTDEPDLEPAWHYLGVSQFYEGDFQEAIAALQKAIELRPGRPETRIYIGRIYELLGAYDEAVAVYQEELRIRIGRDTTDAYSALARGLYLAGRFRDASEAAYQAHLRDNNFVEALFWWGVSEDARGNHLQAVDHLVEGRETLVKWNDLETRLQRLTEEQRVDPDITEEQVTQDFHRAEHFATELGLWPSLNKQLGRAYINADKFAEARNSFRAALEPSQRGNPDDPEALTLIGVAYYEDALNLLVIEDLLFQPIQVLGAAVKQLEKTLKASPDYALAHNALGQVYLLQAETFVSDPARGIISHTYDEAEAEFRTALEQDPQYIDAMVNLARAHSGQQRYAEAAQQLTRALALDPGRADLHAELARANVGLENWDLALEEASIAIQLDPKQVTAYNAAGLAAYYAGDLGTAVENFNRAIDIDPTRHESHTHLGLAFFQMRSWNRARHEFNRALKCLPQAIITNTAIQRSYMLYLVGMTYSNTGAHEQAISSMNEALAIDPRYLDALRQIGRDYASLKDFRASERALRRALQQSPGPSVDAEVLAQLGTVFEAAGEPHEALAAYSEAITKDPQNFEARRGFARLQAN